MRNDEALTEVVRQAATEVLGAENIFGREPGMAGEDLAFVAERVPTCMLGLGVADPDRGIIYPPHHPRFDADEDALATGVKVMVASALKYLNG